MMSWSKIIKSPRVSKQAYCVSREAWEAPLLTADESPAEEVAGLAAAALNEQVRRAQEEERNTIFEQGRQAGRVEAERCAQQELESLRTLVERIEKELAAFLERHETQAVDLALAIARKILGGLDESRAEIVRHSMRKVLARRREPGDTLTLRLFPDDHRLVAPSQEVMPRNLHLVPDPSVGRGGCVLETKFGRVDAQLETQLEEIARVLLGRVETLSEPEVAAQVLAEAPEVREEGHVSNIVGTVIESRGPNVTVGDQCDILNGERELVTRAEVIGFKKNRVLLMPLGERQGIGPGNLVVARGKQFSVRVGPQLLGRVLNGLGEPIDNLGPVTGDERVSLYAQPNNPMERKSITEPLYTGVRAIDSLLTCGKGVRMGIFAGSGVGKSTLLGMMARNTFAEINVIALIGERGREVKEFVERDLGPEGLARSVVVAVTSDESPVLRIHGALLAASLAEFFARQGKDVMFMMDSVTRFAMAQREIGLAAG